MSGGRLIASELRLVRATFAAGVLALAMSGCGGGAGVEPPHSNKREVAIRRYLAEEFLYEKWYQAVGEIDVINRGALVSAAVGSGRKDAGAVREICQAVLSSGEVGEVIVRFGGGEARACR
jgi:hypothetical protein